MGEKLLLSRKFWSVPRSLWADLSWEEAQTGSRIMFPGFTSSSAPHFLVSRFGFGGICRETSSSPASTLGTPAGCHFHQATMSSCKEAFILSLDPERLSWKCWSCPDKPPFQGHMGGLGEFWGAELVLLSFPLIREALAVDLAYLPPSLWTRVLLVV